MFPRVGALTSERPIFVDIDGTLTDDRHKGHGRPIASRIQKLRDHLGAGGELVIWSAGGTDYAKQFAADNGLEGATCVGKPDLFVDDNPTVRPGARIKVISPEEFFGEN